MGVRTLDVQGLCKHFGGRPVLEEITFTLEEGETKVVMGPSGCGKSTLLRCLNRLTEPSAGRILFRGEEVTGAKADVRALRQRIGFVFQHFALYRHLTALDNVTLALRKLQGLGRHAAEEKARFELARMDMLAHEEKYPGQLSGGQKQRVAIARALAMDPAVLFIDEPTSALDPVMAREVVGVINQLRAERVTMLCVTHDVALARSVTEQVIFMDAGRILAEASPAALEHEYADERIRSFFGGAARRGG